METNFLKLYLELNKTLIKTIVIKSDKSAETINNFIALKYGENAVNKDDPTTWKYYKNISGEYHSSDVTMKVTSLDTLEEIVFSKENLVIHTSTREQYLFDTRYYYSLVNQYPDQEQLILGILYPSDITTAIAAENGTILNYPDGLVEPQEITLIPELEDYIKRYIGRWDVQAFGLSDSLYNSAQHAILYLNLIPKLLNLRLKRCKTHEAHSFHIREYLASHNALDKFLPYMTLKQSLFLYRNIKYIERNSGKSEQFKTLLGKFLTDRRIPLSEFSVRQLSQFEDNYSSKITVRRKPTNTRYNVPEKDYFDIADLYTKEAKLVYNNVDYLSINSERITKEFKNSISSAVQSKDLESSMIDYNDAVPEPLEVVLLREWAHMSSQGLYTAAITFSNPRTSDLRTIYADQAFIYMYYVTLKSLGMNITELPVYINQKYRKRTKPTLSKMLSVVDDSFSDFTSIATDILSGQPDKKIIQSTSTFFNLGNKIFEECLRQWYIVSNTHDLNKRAMIQSMIYTLYEDQSIVFPVETLDMDTWLFELNLPVYDYTYAEAKTLITNIFTAATGLKIDSNKLLKNIQTAMIEIMKQLSSYSIQFITEINASKIRPLNWAAIRTGNLYFESGLSAYSEANLRINDVTGYSLVNVHLETVSSKDFSYYESHISGNFELSLQLNQLSYHDNGMNFVFYFDAIRNSVTYDAYDENISATAKFIGWEYYLALTDSQKMLIKSIYN